jgi:ribonuclease HI
MNIYTDGSSRGNPGPAGCAFVVYRDGIKVHEFSRNLGRETNNYAEYQALLDALEYIDNDDVVTIHSDSQLVIKQVNGEWKCRKEKLKPLCKRAQELMKSNYNLVHVSAHCGIEGNEEADRLAVQAALKYNS